MSLKDKETSLWKWLKAGADSLGHGAHLRRVENAVLTGDPDVEGCVGGAEFNIELKTCPEPTRTGGVLVRITEEQIYWHYRRRRAGGQSWLLVRVGSGAKARHYLLPGDDLSPLRKTVQEDWLREQSRIDPRETALGILALMRTRTLV